MGITHFITKPQNLVTLKFFAPRLVSFIKFSKPQIWATYTEINKPPSGNKMLPDKKSKKPNILLPKIVIWLHELKPKTLVIQSKNVIVTHNITDLFLEILNESIAVDTTASNKPIIEVKAAINTKKKNNAPKYIPKGISLNNEAIVTKSKPGPEFGSIPNANNAGNITNHARIAIAVSKKTTIPTLPGISLFSLSK